MMHRAPTQTKNPISFSEMGFHYLKTICPSTRLGVNDEESKFACICLEFNLLERESQ